MMKTSSSVMSLVVLAVVCCFGFGRVTFCTASDFSMDTVRLGVSCPGLGFSSDGDANAAKAKQDVLNAIRACSRLTLRAVDAIEVTASSTVTISFQTNKHARRYNKCINNAIKRDAPLSSGSCSVISSTLVENGCTTTFQTLYTIDVEMNDHARVENLNELSVEKFRRAMTAFGNKVADECMAVTDKCDLDIWNLGSAVVTGQNQFQFRGAINLADCFTSLRLREWFFVSNVVYGQWSSTIGESCDDHCNSLTPALTCQVDSMSNIDTIAEVEFVAGLFSIPCHYSYTTIATGPHPSLYIDLYNYCYASSGTSTCSGYTPNFYHFCCCGTGQCHLF
eukprot:m.28491 g.28491  ORF g.28491 m.28491 type:complete len:336 (+) comp9481_c0_seq1:192-1199(+)